MKLYLHTGLLACIGWPAMALGYLWGAVASGFKTGMCFYDRHESQAICKFTEPAAGVKACPSTSNEPVTGGGQ